MKATTPAIQTRRYSGPACRRAAAYGDDVMRVSDEVELHGRTCRVLALDALIRAKRAMGRPRDHEAILQLETIRELRGRAVSAPPQP